MKRRGRFGEEQPIADDDYNPTKYEEKFTFPTDASAVNSPSQGYGIGAAQAQSGYGYSQAAPSSYNGAQQSGYGYSQSSAPVQDGYGYSQSAPVQGGGAAAVKAEAERPNVFALRSDKDVYVYEYSDRLEYYRNTPNGMLLCNIESKKRF